jgi:hypothetical protein
MNIEEAIIRYGTEAVLEYGKMSDIVAEDVIPEKCLVVFMASRFIAMSCAGVRNAKSRTQSC